MRTTAYTYGHEQQYDASLEYARREGFPMHKVGEAPADEPDYPGGCVFATPEDAQRGISNPAYAVYVLALPGSWDECTYDLDGARHLRVNAEIVGKYEP